MGSSNLAVVFGPTLIHLPESTNAFEDMGNQTMVMEFLLRNHHLLFQESSENLPEPQPLSEGSLGSELGGERSQTLEPIPESEKPGQE